MTILTKLTSSETAAKKNTEFQSDMNKMVKMVNLVMQKNIMRNVRKVRISRQILTFLKILSANCHLDDAIETFRYFDDWFNNLNMTKMRRKVSKYQKYPVILSCQCIFYVVHGRYC